MISGNFWNNPRWRTISWHKLLNASNNASDDSCGLMRNKVEKKKSHQVAF